MNINTAQIAKLLNAENGTEESKISSLKELLNTATKVVSYFEYLTDEHIKLLAESLKENTTLIELDLHLSNIGDTGANYISEALKVNQTLEKINLGLNKIGNEGAKAIAEALTINKNLQEIELRSNWIGNKGAKAIAKALKIQKNLQDIGLLFNRINPAKARYFINDLNRVPWAECILASAKDSLGRGPKVEVVDFNKRSDRSITAMVTRFKKQASLNSSQSRANPCLKKASDNPKPPKYRWRLI